MAKSCFVQSRRTFLQNSLMASSTLLSLDALAAIANTPNKKVFSILHTNDLHSNVIGIGPLRDYSPLTLRNDQTKGGYSRLAALITQRQAELQQLGPVLVLDAGDFSMGTAVAAACRELGAELQLMGRMGYDATTFGNHEFDLGPDGLGKTITKANLGGKIPAILAANTDITGESDKLKDLQRLAQDGVIKPYEIIERGGLRFGLFGIIGYDAAKYTANSEGIIFADPITTTQKIVQQLKQQENVDVIIALSHGGVIRGKNGNFDKGEDLDLLKAVPDLDIVIGGHTHTELFEPLLSGDRPVVQTGKYGENLGELILSLENKKIKVESYRLIPIDDEIQGDTVIQTQVEHFLSEAGKAAFASRGYETTQPLVTISEDWPMNYADVESGTPLANVVTDALRQATGSQIAFTANGLIRAGLIKGNTGGIQTVYDVFALAPLGSGIIDPTAGSALVTGYFTAAELKNILEFFLIDDPNHPGEYFPRISGLRAYYDPKSPRFEKVTALELGNFDNGYHAIELESPTLYSFTTSLYAGVIIAAIPKLTQGALPIQPKKADGSPLKSSLEAIADPRNSTSPYVLSNKITLDTSMTAIDGSKKEIKEWQGIMDYFASLPHKTPEGISILLKNDRVKEVRVIKI